MSDEIRIEEDRLKVPDHPLIPFITGDGIGADITPAMRRVIDGAIEASYGVKRKIEWVEVLAGDKALEARGEYLPQASLDTIRELKVGIKGPLTTPVGGGFRSLNVALRQILDLYSCVRPVRWYGSASPLKQPGKMDMVIFRENTEDVYTGVEFESGSDDAKRVIDLLRAARVGEDKVPADSAVGIKHMSPSRTKRHVRKAARWALEKRRRGVTFMHKGNIMKFTEGAFLRWAFEVLEEPEFKGCFVTEKELMDEHGGKMPRGKLFANDRIADNMFQQILTRTDEYDMIVAPNLNGDYISDAAAAGVGGLGMAPGANIGDFIAVFEATHGTAPKYAGQDKMNPSSLILSGAMMLEYLGWVEAASAIHRALEATLRQRKGTYDLIRGWRNEGEEKLTELSCSEFADALVDNME
jgi:isocitrate dehydrogenase